MPAGDTRGYTTSQTYSTGGQTYTPPVSHHVVVDGYTNVNSTITLSATDPNSPAQTLTYAVFTLPRHGKIVNNGTTITSIPTNGFVILTGDVLTYEPDAGYYGDDSFAFFACNEFACSSPAAVSILLVPQAPVAVGNSGVLVSTPTPFTLQGTDPNSPALPIVSYTITKLPLYGTLSGTAPNLTYSPNANFPGTDSLQFVVSNGGTTSAVSSPATVVFTNGNIKQ